MLEGSDFLLTFAQVGFTVVAVAAIISAFQSKELHERDRGNVVILVEVSSLIAFFSFLPIPLDGIFSMIQREFSVGGNIWHFCSLLAAAASIAMVVNIGRSRPWKEARNAPLTFGLLGSSVILAGIMLINSLIWGHFAWYGLVLLGYFGLMCILLASMMRNAAKQAKSALLNDALRRDDLPQSTSSNKTDTIS